MTGRYRPNSPNVVHEDFDNEVVVVNLENGNYFSLNQSASFIWKCLDAGLPAQDIVQIAQQRSNTDSLVLGDLILRFLAQLQKEGLIISSDSSQKTAHFSPPVTNWGLHPFPAPELQRYTDMQDLLLLDPIHDVDQSGWPTPPQGSYWEGK